ncbi:hypothetical protein [Natrinema thermotolerans]|uniref:hypothetical protein n=1 Tax=Natrinema thermotolerans TaxID=121872 RepID=UPI000678C418|nr:hypothetical protein [Natrinema thermotolerans]QCC57192.1 hypothetical protein DVR14_00520 [Natrinema thermotolerans]
MTRAYIHLPEQTAVTDLANGGTIAAAGPDVYAPERLGIADTGVAFGPVLIETPPGGVAPLESLTFLPGSDSGGGLLAVGAPAAVAASDDETTATTRRGVLTFLAAVLGAAAVADTAGAADDELVTLNVAKCELAEPTAPVTVSVIDAVADVLPPTSEILIDQQNARVGKIVDQGEGVTLRQTAGPVRIYVRDTVGNLSQLLAWVKSFLPADSSLTYSRPFPDGKAASDFAEDEFVRLSSHPTIVGPIEASEQDRTILSIGDATVPHADDGGIDVGAWSLLDGTLIWEVGPDPPDATDWSVRTRLSAWQSIEHEYL